MVALQSPNNNNVYYGSTAFALFSPISVLYTAVAHVFFARFLKVRPLPPTPPTLASSAPVDTTVTPKIAVVTGSNTGIGFETAKALAERGYVVILACRSRDKAMAAAAAIPNSVFVQPLDLSSKASIAAFATNIKETYTKIDVLVNNAGINTSGKLDGGLDLCFQSNFLGHFLLTQLLSPLLKQGRVVNLSSVMHHFAENANKDEVYWKRCTEYHPDQSTYTPSKLAALLFTMELNQRGIRSMAVNPGAVNSDIWRGFPRWIIPIFQLLYLNNAQGCQTSVAACIGDFPAEDMYLQPYWVPPSFRHKPAIPWMEMLGPFVGHAVTKPRLPEDADAAAKALWTISEQVTGVKFF